MIRPASYTSPYQQWLNELQQFDQTQLTFSNTTGQDQVVKLWAANEGNFFQNTQINFETGASPQAIAFDKSRQLFFVVNQLDSSVDVFNSSGTKQARILLEADEFAFASPLAIEVDQTSGTVFVIGAISNRLYVITSNFEVSDKITLDNRPISMVLNPVNKQLYISHLLIKQVTIIDLNSLEIKTRLATDEVVTSLAVQSNTGEWLTVSPDTNTIQVFSSTNQPTSKLTNLSEGVIKAKFLNTENTIVTIASTQKEILTVETSTGRELAKQELSSEPISLTIGKGDTIFVGTDQPATLHSFDQNLMLLSASSLSSVHSEMYVSEENQQVFIPNPATSNILVQSLGEGQNIKASDNYEEVLTDFQNQPAIVRHLKLFYSGKQIAPVLRLGTRSSRGKKTSKVVSLNQYQSPQHFRSIYEVFASHGEIIDGSAFWELTLPKDQQLTIMLYYEQ